MFSFLAPHSLPPWLALVLFDPAYYFKPSFLRKSIVKDWQTQLGSKITPATTLHHFISGLAKTPDMNSVRRLGEDAYSGRTYSGKIDALFAGLRIFERPFFHHCESLCARDNFNRLFRLRIYEKGDTNLSSKAWSFQRCDIAQVWRILCRRMIKLQTYGPPGYA